MSGADAITALGPLFRITEVFLLDDAVVNMSRNDAFAEEPSGSYTTADANLSFKHTINDYTSVEDLELARQMESLGLPISFSTTSEKKNVSSRGRKKGIENKVHGTSRVGELKDVKSSEVFHDRTNLASCCKTTEVQIPASHHDEEEHNRGHVCSDEDSVNSDELSNLSMDSYVDKEIMQKEDKNLKSSSISCDIIGAKSDDDDIKTSQPCVSSIESSLSCASVVNHSQDHPDDSILCEFGDWRVFWDAFYMRNYFYNFQTQESTWYPPPGLENLAISCSTSDSHVLADEAKEDVGSGFACDAIKDHNAYSLHDSTDSFQETGCTVEYIDESSQKLSSKMNHATHISIFGINGLAADSVTCPEALNVSYVSLEVSIKDSLTRALNEEGCDENWRRGSPETYMTSTMDNLVNHHEIAALKKKKRVRRLQSQLTSGVIGGLPDKIVKYWCQRYLLFSRFDKGIKMDEEGWFSVTPEPIARHHASRCGCGTVIDCFTGVGGNAIQFALRSNHVIAIDIDQQKIDYAQHNAAIYGVGDMIDFVKGDFFQVATCLKGDTVFMSPPWGGPDYLKVQTYDITSMLKPHDGRFLFTIAKTIASRVVMFLPRNIDVNQLAELSLSVNPPWALEVEKSFLNGKLKAVTAYFQQQ